MKDVSELSNRVFKATRMYILWRLLHTQRASNGRMGVTGWRKRAFSSWRRVLRLCRTVVRRRRKLCGLCTQGTSHGNCFGFGLWRGIGVTGWWRGVLCRWRVVSRWRRVVSGWKRVMRGLFGLSPWHRLMGTSHGSWSGLQRQVSISWVSHTCSNSMHT